MSKSWSRRLIKHPLSLDLLRWSKRYAIPGFGGVPIYTIVRFLYEAYTKDRLMTRANSIAFNLMLAIFPALIFLLTLLPYLPFAVNYSQLMLDSLEEVMPREAHSFLSEIVGIITGRRNQGLLSIGFVLAIIFSSNGMLSLMTAFNKRDKTHFKRRSIIRERLIALFLTVSIGVLFVAALILVVAGNSFFSFLNLADKIPKIAQYSVIFGKWVVTFLMIYIGVTVIYRYAPKLKRRIPIINPGSVMVTIFSLITSIVFSYIVNEFGRYDQLYGPFGALIVIMIWLQINAFIILAGFELNASIAMNQPLDDLKVEED